MKPIYSKHFVAICLAVSGVFLTTGSKAQCPGGYTPGSTAYDTTIVFGTGVTSTPVYFPKFDPQNGTVNCVRLCITITGVIDTLAIENFSFAPQTANFQYDRTDQLTGPGLGSPLSNTVSASYGPYSLAPNNSVFGSGPDFTSLSHDTVLNKQLCRVITDTTTINTFYGTDSMVYNYNISVSANATVTGGSSFVFVLTSALVNFHFEYCTCPPLILPNWTFPINANKVDAQTAEITWTKPNLADEDYVYELEVSPDGNRFYNEGTISKDALSADGAFHYNYRTSSNQQTNYYFRVKIKFANGSYRYSQTKTVQLGTQKGIFTVFPNPSKGIVGIKFDGSNPATWNIQIVNINGQTIYNGKVDVAGPTYKQLTTLSDGMYWLRLSDQTGQLSAVNQLLIVK
ncbi:MAG: choice-of-anchor E domain-containing protein [Chitinophagaceae bacterium]|nr:choice-of-anchor E domain-containing protein [Chitinophagaceae bacterium]